MIFRGTSPQRRFLVPEVVQTSAMDCGPASLKALLAGFDISVNYGRLREACMTDVDGTSIDTLEEISVTLGLDAVQVMVPEDHLLLPEACALPALVVIRQPGGLTHFVILWRTHKKFVQVMDPSTGRVWWTHKRLLNSLYIHSFPVTDDFACTWVSDDTFIASLQARLASLDIQRAMSEELVSNALETDTWQAVASLDAATRLTETLVRTKGIRSGTEATKVLRQFIESVANCSSDEAYTVIPEKYWCVQKNEQGELLLCGAVLIAVSGKVAEYEEDTEQEDAEQDDDVVENLSSLKISAALQEPERHPGREILRTILENGRLFPAILVVTLMLSSIGTTLEALLLKGLFEIAHFPTLTYYRTEILVALVAFFSAMLMLELSGAATILRIGQWLEVRFRVSILQKIPLLGDRYFHSRLTSDMAQRVYELRALRGVPELAVTVFRSIF
ncbi:MAG: cysteine peptidase family C39 domain-containing protein, partial [Candidatus Electrothrix sp.]